jgi:hypothetical protein
MDISPSLVNDFRNYLNKNETLLLKIFGNIEGEKNHWLLINSCLDWITVAVSYVTDGWNILGTPNEKSMQLFSLISSADLIFEGICQLNRVITGSEKLPFNEEKIIFFDKFRLYEHLDDNLYFKELRTFFGAHPVNIKRHGVNKPKDEDRFYASWSHEIEPEIYSIQIYPLSSKLQIMNAQVNILQLKAFIETRYGYLHQLIEAIENKIMTYKKKFISIKMKKKGAMIERLQYLQVEARNRFNSSYINDVLKDLLLIYSTDLDICINELGLYKQQLELLVEEILNNLQNMVLDNLKYDYLLPNSTSPPEISYSLSKILGYIHNEEQENLIIQSHISNLNNYCDNKYSFALSDDKPVIYLKICLLLFSSRSNSY